MKVIDFRFLTLDDKNSSRYENWSRTYEYPVVINFIKEHIGIGDKIHNSSWGFGGVHIPFSDDLDVISKNVLHSDITTSTHRETYYYDITKEKKEFENTFDFVLNISTIEHLNNKEERIASFKNLYNQVKTGGYLILTFDYPRVELHEFENLVGEKCKKEGEVLSGANSIIKNDRYHDLNIILLIVQK